jgi:hypothetical protein
MFNLLKKLGKTTNHQYPLMRDPLHSPRCYELTDAERLIKIREWNNRNIWNDPSLTYEDALAQDLPKNRYYGA